jgi:hypothetical protein
MAQTYTSINIVLPHWSHRNFEISFFYADMRTSEVAATILTLYKILKFCIIPIYRNPSEDKFSFRCNYNEFMKN